MTNNPENAQFRVQASLFITDSALLNQIITDYPGQTDLIDSASVIVSGVSPVTLQVRYGSVAVPSWGQIDNPTSEQQHHVGLFTFSAVPSYGQVLGNVINPLTIADGLQTLGGVNYTDPNGTVFTSVTWDWEVTVQRFDPADDTEVNTWDQQIVQWTGDGTTARLIPTTVDLTKHNVIVWVFPQTSDLPCFRHSRMTGTMGAAGFNSAGGVMALQAGGFTVTDNLGLLIAVNTAGHAYTAVVIRASTNYMKVGTYTGQPAFSSTCTVKIGTNFYNGPGAVGQSITIGGSFGTVIVVSGANGRIGGTCPLDGSQTVTGLGGQTLHLGSGIVPTAALIFGRATQCAIKTEDMPAAQGTSLGNEAKNLTDQIIALGTDINGPLIGTSSDNNVNGALTYYYVAFQIPSSDVIRQQFHTFKVTGTGSNIAATGFGFVPSFATCRIFSASATGSVWRGPGHATTHSTTYSGASDVSGTNGIVSFDADGLTIGSTLVTNGIDGYGIALKGAGSVTTLVQPTWVSTATVTNSDGTTSTIEATTQAATPPQDGNVWTLQVTPAPQWWCNAVLGESVFQIDSPGAGWVACSGPVSNDGWFLSTAKFAGQDVVVSGGKPADPRQWSKIATWATGYAGSLGGSPGAACSFENQLIYPAGTYVVGTEYPPIRKFNGRTDGEICRVPPTTANLIPKAVMSMLAANGTVFFSTWDSGTSNADWNGRVFQLDITSGVTTILGTKFADGELPYALAWHMGRLWCGTNNGIGTVGKIYFFRPGIDTAWTLDHATSTDSAGGVDSLLSYGGKLYVGTDNAAASRGKVLVRNTAGAYTTSHTASGGTAVVNNGYLSMAVLGTNMYASYFNGDSPAIVKIEKFDGTTWTTAYTGIGTTLKPFIMLVVDAGTLYALAGGVGYPLAIVSTIDGASWVDLSTELPETTTTCTPMFGVVVL